MCTRILKVLILVLLHSPAGLGQDTNVLGDAEGDYVTKDAVTKDAVPRRVCLVVGAAGESEYGEAFQKWSSRIRNGVPKGSWLVLDGVDDSHTVASTSAVSPDDSGGKSHRERILHWIRETPEQTGENWLIFLGHGTHEGKVTQLNLLGPDLSAAELGEAMRGKLGRWVVVLCCSSSAPFITAISGPDRVIITATKSGAEQNLSRFGDYFSQGFSDPAVDLDHDHEVSVLELFLAASNKVLQHYEDRGLLATEQALLDDNGDGKGTPAVFYRGLRAVKGPAEAVRLDGSLARVVIVSANAPEGALPAYLVERDRIEREIEVLRARKGEMEEGPYYEALEKLFLQLAKLASYGGG